MNALHQEESPERQRFCDLLRELFQFDCADLDFGIYRIMNHKRSLIEKFISEDLPRAISEELCKRSQEELQALEKARTEVCKALGERALDADDNLDPKYHDTPAGKTYLEALERAKGARSVEQLERDVYNHLYTFFSRYWQDGDFISKRRYSWKQERYAIPYNGEEVYLYWANQDQYYVKTGEYFTDYAYQAPNGVSVHFKLKQADVEQDNVKGEKRFFLPVLDEIAWDAGSRTLTIPFQFRPLSHQEEAVYGSSKQQESIIKESVTEIPKRVCDGEALSALTHERRSENGASGVSLLEYHLCRYTRRNTSDFFIHKDLKGFLTRELDFYLKNEVLNLYELEAAGEERVEGWFQLMKTIRAVGGRIIEFLHQIEEFQKMLWEKRKFVTETQYCITLRCIPEEFYREIAENGAQWCEWKTLLHIDDEKADLFTVGQPETDRRIEFLKSHPTLVLDTKHFSPNFTDRLLASFDNLDDVTDGLLIHSENWQALNLLREKYRERVKCIYIDPPYNTGNDEFIYRDSYQYSSWLTMMETRLKLARTSLVLDGCVFVNIDDHETSHLRLLLDSVYGADNYIGTAVWKRTVSRPLSGAKILSAHDYVIAYQCSPSFQVKKLRVEDADSYKNPDNDARGPYKLQKFERTMSGARPTMTYAIDTPQGPITRTWSGPKETYERLLADNRIVFSRSGLPYYKQFLSEVEGQLPSTWWQIEHAYNQHASAELQSLFAAARFETAKPVGLLDRVLRISCDSDSGVLDYFAGSGTTAHAVINLNREDGGQRKFILVEMADYFNTVLLPRIKKVVYTPEWKDGKPKRQATAEEAQRSPRVIKYIRLESYEDCLNNITFDQPQDQHVLQFEDYMLKYMLKWESRHCETLLNPEKLAQPFSYTLRIYRDGETREQPVDLPETFNYLIGLDVQTRRVLYDGDRRYLVYKGATRECRTAAVIWRDIAGWTQEDFTRDLEFVLKHNLTEGAQDVYVNGDSVIPEARSLDAVFKQRMFASVEAS